MTLADSNRALHQPSRRPWRWILLALILAVAGMLLWRHFAQKKSPKKTPAQVVQVARASAGSMPVVLNELGTVTPIATVTVLPNQAVSGYLVSVPFREGQDVQKGQLLAQIDPRPYEVLKQQAEAQLAKDQASLAQARSDFGIYQTLANQKSIAGQTYIDQKFLVQQDEAAIKADQANVAQYALDISYCRITAPVSGRVGLRLVDQGNYVTGSSSTGLATITTIRPTTVEFTVAQNDIDPVVEHFKSSGGKLQVTAFTSDNSKKLATGTLYALSNQMTTSTGTVSLRATFPNDDEALFPSEFVNVQLLVNTLANAILVPTAAVQNGAPGDYVYLVNKDNTVSVHKVVIGPSDGTNTVITSGLVLGNIVVTDGTDRLSDGATIKVAGAHGTGGSGAGGSGGGRHHKHGPSSGDGSAQ